MIGRSIGRHGYWLAVGALSVGIGLMVAVTVVSIVVPELQRAGVIADNVAPTPPPSTTPSPGTSLGVDMGGAALPGDVDCTGCHVTNAGTIGLRPMPVIGHPLEGWSKCTNCHVTAGLVDSAPGHSGIHASECTVCHKAGDLPEPLSRPHRSNKNQDCLSCHGDTAPLPTDMRHRSEGVCWLCHRLPTIEPPVPAHETAPREADCLTCHVADGPAGRLPTDHVERPSTLCLTCHEVVYGTAAGGPSRIATWSAP